MESETEFYIKTKILSSHNVIGYSETLKPRVKNGKELFGTETIRVYVTKKKSKLKLLFTGGKVPRKINNIETDVVEIGELKALAAMPPNPRHGMWGSLIGGISIGHEKITAGTFARMVFMDGKPYALSNNHVLANSLFKNGDQSKAGDKIYQPGPYDIQTNIGEEISDKFLAGRLVEAVPFIASTANKVDAAIASVDISRGWFSHSQLFLDIDPSGVPIRLPTVGMKVTKSGRTTDITTGTVLDENATVKVGGYSGNTVEFENQIIISGDQSKAFVQGGDSGSLLLDIEGKNMVGLIFAGSDVVGIANRMDEVEKAFSKPLSFVGEFYHPAGEEYVPPEEPNLPKYRYLPSEVEVTVMVETKTEERASTIMMEPINKVYVGDSFTLSGKLFDSVDSTPLANRIIKMGNSEITTDSEGKFTYLHSAYSSPGQYAIKVSFAGD